MLKDRGLSSSRFYSGKTMRLSSPQEAVYVLHPGLSRPGSIDRKREDIMAVARVTEISSTSSTCFEDAIQQGLARAIQALRHGKSAWIKEQSIELDNGKIASYQVNMKINLVLDDTITGASHSSGTRATGFLPLGA